MSLSRLAMTAAALLVVALLVVTEWRWPGEPGDDPASAAAPESPDVAVTNPTAGLAALQGRMWTDGSGLMEAAPGSQSSEGLASGAADRAVGATCPLQARPPDLLAGDPITGNVQSDGEYPETSPVDGGR